LKKAAQKLSGIRACGVGGKTPQTKIQESFFVSFFSKKEMLTFLH
jgi:hypothetical protein